MEANGEGDGEGTHITVGTCLMRGEFDSQLKWPFRGTVTIQLVNQLEDKEHHTVWREGCWHITFGGLWTVPSQDGVRLHGVSEAVIMTPAIERGRGLSERISK